MGMFSFEAPEDLGGESEYLKQEGQYHVVVTDVREGQNHKGEMIHGFSVEFTALAGPEVGKKLNLNFKNGEATHKDGGKMAAKKQAAFLIATNCIEPNQLGKQVNIDLEAARGQQFCIDLENGQPNEKWNVFLNLRFANCWHVDDPAASKVAKDEKSLAVIPANLRRKPEYFAGLHAVAKKAAPPKDDKNFDDL